MVSYCTLRDSLRRLVRTLCVSCYTCVSYLLAHYHVLINNLPMDYITNYHFLAGNYRTIFLVPLLYRSKIGAIRLPISRLKCTQFDFRWGSIKCATIIFTVQCTLVQMRGLGIACRLSVCPSVTLVICDHIGWKSWKLIAQTISPTPSLFAAKR